LKRSLEKSEINLNGLKISQTEKVCLILNDNNENCAQKSTLIYFKALRHGGRSNLSGSTAIEYP
jgi:hypothetical protein